MRRLASILIIAGLTFACSGEKEKSSDDSEASESKKEDDATNADGTEIQDENDPLFQLGMPDHCSLVTKSDQGCFQCQPRDLPLEECITLPSSFDASADCTHDLDKLMCQVANFEWDFNDRSKVEEMYERIPVVFTIIKAIVAQKFKDKPETNEHIGMILDHLMKYRLDLFTGQNLDKIASEGVDIIQTIRPDLEINKEQAEQTLANLIAVVDEKRNAGELQEADILMVLANMFGQLPDGIGEIVDSLQAGNLDALQGDLLEGFMDGESNSDAGSEDVTDAESDSGGGGTTDGESDNAGGDDTGNDGGSSDGEDEI